MATRRHPLRNNRRSAVLAEAAPPSPGLPVPVRAPPQVQIPRDGWAPRRHQGRLWNYLQGDPTTGGLNRRAIAIWHRRAGKDEILLHHTAVSMQKRPANYWHCLPEYGQARKAIWTAINPKSGLRRIDEAFPPEYRENTNDHEMFIRFKNGATWQLIGSDRYDATVGSTVAGITYSEWALANPSAWAYHRPILEEANGWAAFISTPRGRNHCYDMFNYARQNPARWFSERLTVDDTGALTADQLTQALQEYQALYGLDVGTAQFQQEYYCDWAAAILGAFYALEMAAVRNENRVILDLDPIPDLPIHRAWDLGVSDDTAIWFFQPSPNGQILVLDYYVSSGVGLEHYTAKIEDIYKQHGWLDKTGTNNARNSIDYVPHDAKVKEFGSGRTRVETMRAMGLNPALVPHAGLDDGINAARRTLPLCVFHERTRAGLEALEAYRREWDDERKSFRANPLHDWASHGADAFRYLAMGWRRPAPQSRALDHASLYPVLRRSGDGIYRPHVQLPTGWIIPPPAELGPYQGWRNSP